MTAKPSTNTPPSQDPTTPLKDMDVHALYYAGIPSKPRLVAAKGLATWQPFSPISAEPTLKWLYVASSKHPLRQLWDTMGPRITSVLDERIGKDGVLCVNVVRIGDDDTGKEGARMVIWIGVSPGTLTEKEGLRIIDECGEILAKEGIQDVDVEIRETSLM